MLLSLLKCNVSHDDPDIGQKLKCDYLTIKLFYRVTGVLTYEDIREIRKVNKINTSMYCCHLFDVYAY